MYSFTTNLGVRTTGKNIIIKKQLIWYFLEYCRNHKHIALSLILKLDEMYWKIHTFMIFHPYIYLFFILGVILIRKYCIWKYQIVFFFSYFFLLFVTIAYFLRVDFIRTWCTIWLKYKAFQILLISESYFFFKFENLER